ncbi:autotransporter domain-containing protein [Candidatus Pelagibacter sp.]|nr:autotransporter domain-containing protein [Candidatus Pelagibacter sp.]
MNNAINTLVLATVDSLTKFKNKFAYYLAIFAMVFGSTFGTFNAANAAEVSINGNAKTVTDIDDPADTIVFTASATTGELTLDGGDIAAASIAQGTAGAMVLTVTDNAVPVSNLTISGDVTAGTAALTIKTDDNTVQINLGGNVTEDSVAIKFQLDNTAILAFTGTTKNIDGIIDGIADNEGTVNFEGVTEVDEAMGGVNHLKLINVATTKSADFNAAVNSTALTTTGTGDANFDAAVGVDTITNNGTITVASTIDNEAADGDAAIVMNSSTSVLNFNGSTALEYDVVITATTDGEGTINFIDSADNAAATNTTAGGDIGANGKKIGAIKIGSATKAGNLTTINGDAIFASAITITGGNVDAEDSSLDLHENIGDANDTVAIVLNDNAGDALLDIGTVSAIFGTIDGNSGTAGAGSSTIDANAALTVEDSIGSSNVVEALDIGDTTTLKGAVNNITATTFTADDILNISGAAAQTLTSTITATNEQGELNIVNATHLVTIAGTVGAEAARLKEIDIADNATTKFSNAVFALALDVNTAAAADVTTWTIGNVIGDDGTTAGTMDVAGGTFVLDTAVVDGTTVFDTKEVLNNDSGVELRGLVIQPSANFTSGTVTFIDGATAASIDADDITGLASVTDTALTDFTINATAGVADVTITAAAKSTATTATELSISTNEATAIHQLMEAAIAGDTTLMSTLNDSLTGVNSGTTSTTTDLAIQAAPQTDTIGGSSVATRAMTGTVQGIVSNRMASLRSGDAFVTGMSAGNGMSANSGFIQAFGSEGEQKNTSSSGATVYGFDTETSGVAIGFDGITDDGSTIGLSASYSSTDVDGKGTGKSKNSIDSYTVSVYADKATENGYIEGSLTYGINENAASRLVNTAGLDRTYSADYDSNQISLKVGGGVPQEVRDGTFVTPFMSATATSINTDAYTEKSTTANDALRLRVEQDDINSLVGSLGVKAHMVTDNGTPMISLAVNNEFGDAQINTQNTYQGGGTKFKTTTEVEELSATLGLGFSFGNDVTSLNLNYEANVNDDEYVNQYGSIKIVAKF